VWAAPADEKSRVDQRLQQAQQQLGAARGKERVLTDEVSAYSERIRRLETRLAPLRARTQELQAELAGLQERLRSLNARLRVERRRLARAEALLATRQRLLGARLRDIYVRGEPDPIVMLIESRSFSAAVETADIFDRVVEADNGLVKSVKRHADAVRATRDRIAATRADVAASEARTADATRESIAAKAELERQRSAQAEAREGRRRLLERVQGDRADLEAETADLQARSAALAAQIVAAQSGGSSGSSGSGGAPAPSGSVSTGGASSSGLAWPVHGTLTSNFGTRWGRMHEGIDIAGGSGTPIGAAAAGRVILAGQQSGYGNIVVVDHGNGLSTAYAHLSSISVGVGQSVGQGTVIGGMGTTGHSTGVHLHFEVRVNGAPSNPLNYL
jgi:murein DD-endopeptidase MepM/ murein hydrolase activator NlpD